jgi:hypothetical protein
MIRSESSDLGGGVTRVARYGEDGQLTMELFTVEQPFIMLSRVYTAGVLNAEQYVVDGKMVPRCTYELARPSFPALPPGNERMTDMAPEQRVSAHTDATPREKLDAFCRERMAEGVELGEDGRARGKTVLLGERTARASSALISRLRSDGVVRIVLTDLDEDDDHVGAGAMVVELPTGATARAKVLARITELSEELGFDAHADEGQTHDFVMLD